MLFKTEILGECQYSLCAHCIWGWKMSSLHSRGLQRVAGAQNVLRFSTDKRGVRFCKQTEDERNLLTLELLFRGHKGEDSGDNTGRLCHRHHHHHHCRHLHVV